MEPIGYSSAETNEQPVRLEFAPSQSVESSAARHQRHYDDPSASSACPGASGGFP